MVSANRFAYKNEPSIEQVKVLVYILCLRCYHSSETHVPITKKPNSAQLGSAPYSSHKLHPGAHVNVGIRHGIDT